MAQTTYNIRELDPDDIHPSTETMTRKAQGGSKTVVIGKPGTGKSTLIKSLLYEKKHIFPVGMAMSGTEASNQEFSSFFPPSFVYSSLDMDAVTRFKRRQNLARQYLTNPWAVCLFDDLMDNPKVFNSPVFLDLFKNGRHYKAWYILSMQYCLDLKPNVRTAIDNVFILREPILRNRRALFENYGACVGDFGVWCQIMDQLTDDYTALYINNQTISNNIEDIVFYYRAKPVPSDFRFGSDDYWEFHNDRYNPEYVVPL